MRSIRAIFRGDLRRVTASIVSIVILLGLCVVPCLYAWFNIFSNWDPYGPDATSRIPVAVVSEDKGGSLLGLEMNIGDKILEALEANDTIGWVFPESKDEAMTLLEKSDCYAVLVVSDDFTQDVFDSLSGGSVNPKLHYYENDKKNAIAPKITGKAKTAVQQQVNTTFIETITGYLADFAHFLSSMGVDGPTLIAKLQSASQSIRGQLGTAATALDALSGLNNTAQTILTCAYQFTGDTADAATSAGVLLGDANTVLSGTGSLIDKTNAATRDALDAVSTVLGDIQTHLNKASQSLDDFHTYTREKLTGQIQSVAALSQQCRAMSQQLQALGATQAAQALEALAGQLDGVRRALETVQSVADAKLDEAAALLATASQVTAQAQEAVGSLSELVSQETTQQVQQKLQGLQQTLDGAAQLLAGTDSVSMSIRQAITDFNTQLSSLETGLLQARSGLGSVSSALDTADKLLEHLSGDKEAQELTDLLQGNGKSLAEYLASPVAMETVDTYPIATYGSAMAPFYTVLAQWVGTLLCATFLKVGYKPRPELERPSLAAHFFGRYGIFLLVGLVQAVIVAAGDLLYVQIQCLYPWKFLLAACVNGLVFSLINYAMVFALDNIGMALDVILLVVQVAGAGGTYPVEVLPEIFQKLNPYMPFRYAMDAMRECVAGSYGTNYWKDLGILLIFLVVFTVLGLALYRPAKGLNRLIAQSKNRTGIMV